MDKEKPGRVDMVKYLRMDMVKEGRVDMVRWENRLRHGKNVCTFIIKVSEL